MREIRICIVLISIPRFFFAIELTVFWLERLHSLSLCQLHKVSLSSTRKFSCGIPGCRHGAPCRQQSTTMDSWQRFSASIWRGEGGAGWIDLKDILHLSNDQVFPNYTPRPSKGAEEVSSVKVPGSSSAVLTIITFTHLIFSTCMSVQGMGATCGGRPEES